MTTTIRTAAILATGDEITGGRTVDTNSAWIADRLAEIGIDVSLILGVSDDVDRISWAWRSGVEKADLVISTGGLGPTSDDLTTEAVAAVAGAALELDNREAERIREFFRSRGRVMPENNLRQAMIPAGAVIVPNPVGTAPGYRLSIARTGGGASGRSASVGIVLPGVPREMKPMFEASVLPWIREHVDPSRVVVSQTFSTFGLPESALDERLRGAVPPSRGRLSFRASFPKITVRIGVAGARETAARELEALAHDVRARIAEVVYAEGDLKMEEVVGRLLGERKLMLATAESCTGGLLSSRITDVAGSSGYYSGGVVAYSNDLKQRLLGVRVKTLNEFGAVSEQTAREMATGALSAGAADISIATTGIAGPDGGTPEKPVGTVAIAIARRVAGGSDEVDSRLYRFWGGRDWIKILTAQVALDWIRRSLLGLPVLEPGNLTPARPKTEAA
ncbi:MAG TPA: competence/damage-inducible protein A [Candidatus Limnocylindrales bacterium]|nr:competence/damage-inducible protein A [Candidatus Limnocylindrales bacterium]